MGGSFTLLAVTIRLETTQRYRLSSGCDNFNGRQCRQTLLTTYWIAVDED